MKGESAPPGWPRAQPPGTTCSHIAWNPLLRVPGTQLHKAADVEVGGFSQPEPWPFSKLRLIHPAKGAPVTRVLGALVGCWWAGEASASGGRAGPGPSLALSAPPTTLKEGHLGFRTSWKSCALCSLRGHPVHPPQTGICPAASRH